MLELEGTKGEVISVPSVHLEWITPDAEFRIARMARVSNPKNQDSREYVRLLRYLIKHKHWSPFEMACMCLEINCTREVAHQIVRHRSFSFQEFSQRYAEVPGIPVFCEARMQHPTNRQASVPCDNVMLEDAWLSAQSRVWYECYSAYQWALGQGIAKEVARKLLPEGLTPTRLYMQGTIRSWLHYVQVRLDGSQSEHKQIALLVQKVLREQVPNIAEAFFDNDQGEHQ